MNFRFPRLYAIINASGGDGLPPSQVCGELLAAGVRWIQFRSKQASTREVYTEGLKLAGLIQSAGGVLIINDRVDVAQAVEANGVHVGQDDLPVEMARRLLGPDRSGVSSPHPPGRCRRAAGRTATYAPWGQFSLIQTNKRLTRVGVWAGF